MKKILSLFLVLCLLLSVSMMASCNKEETETTESVDGTTTTAPAVTTEKPDAGTTAPSGDDTTGSNAPSVPEVALPEQGDTQTDYTFNEPHPVY